MFQRVGRIVWRGVWLRVAFLDLDLDEVEVIVLNSKITRYSLLGVDVVGGWFTW